MKKLIFAILLFVSLLVVPQAVEAKYPVVEPSYAWTLLPPLGLRTPAPMDTTLYNYYQQAIPSEVSIAYASTGNLGAEGMNMIFFDRKPMSDFFFRDALLAWLPMQSNHKFYNTRIPMTVLSFNTGGSSETTQDRLRATFSGNVNSKLQFGANVDYLYSKGSYANQATNDVMWGLCGSYIGDQFDSQVFFNHYNNVNKENGGITDDRYITDPAEVQGGSTRVDFKSIPTNLTSAHTRMVGQEFYMSNRYKMGYWHVTPPSDTIPEDTIEHRVFIPVSSVAWTLDYNDSRHVFDDRSSDDLSKFWANRYLSARKTHDETKYWSLRNTVGLSLIEGFHKYAKAGFSAFVTHEFRRYYQTEDKIPIGAARPENLTPYPFKSRLPHRASENFLWVGGQITKQSGKLFRYDATASVGILGRAIGEVHVGGNISTRFKLVRDTVSVTGYASFDNESAPYLMNNYVSNHFIWHNDFGKIRRLRFGGLLDVPFTNTYVNVGVENLQNNIYFNAAGMPVQAAGSVQVFSASLEQNFRVGILNWRNKLTYQTSSDQSVVPLPKFAAYSNLYILFRIAKVLHVQLGVDCDYYTKYYAPSYQPATMAFCNQQKVKVGNYPFMNVYINMKLKRARFFVMMTHVNQGLMGNNYFAMPNYPMNPRRFQMGVSVDFLN